MNYFEGYYVKCVGKQGSVAVIFGRQACGREKSSFIQIITKKNSYSATYKSAGKISKSKFEARVDKNFSDKTGLFLDIDTQDLTVKGNVVFGEFAKIKYGAMGPFKFLPFMECRHTVASMKHALTGQITINGETYDFDGGTGYIEGDRGRSFPQKYFWSQHNCEERDISVFASAAVIPYMGLSFTGTVCVIHLNGAEHRFATYLGARVKQIDDKKLLIKQGNKKLEIQVLDDKTGLPLFAPMKGGMNRVIEESLERTVRYQFLIGEDVMFDLVSEKASHEYSSLRA